VRQQLARLRVPDQFFHRQPTHALDEGAFDLADVDGRVQAARPTSCSTSARSTLCFRR
jgi:hypothetical protein